MPIYNKNKKPVKPLLKKVFKLLYNLQSKETKTFILFINVFKNESLKIHYMKWKEECFEQMSSQKIQNCRVF